MIIELLFIPIGAVSLLITMGFIMKLAGVGTYHQQPTESSYEKEQEKIRIINQVKERENTLLRKAEISELRVQNCSSKIKRLEAEAVSLKKTLKDHQLDLGQSLDALIKFRREIINAESSNYKDLALALTSQNAIIREYAQLKSKGQ